MRRFATSDGKARDVAVTTLQAQAAAEAVERLPQEATTSEKAAAIQGAMPPPTGEALNNIWYIVICGLMAILILAALTLFNIVGDDKVSDDKIITIFTTVFAGIIGLFVPSPATKKT